MHEDLLLFQVFITFKGKSGPEEGTDSVYNYEDPQAALYKIVFDRLLPHGSDDLAGS